jgi:putative transcriptional regulator
MSNTGEQQIKIKSLIVILPASLILLVLILFAAKSKAATTNSDSLSISTRPHLQSVQSFNTDLLRGVFIVANPKIIDPSFSRTVILLIHNERKGSTGLIINRPTSVSLSEKFPIIKEHLTETDHIFSGGPVFSKTLTLLFQSKLPPSGMIPVLDNIYVSRDMDLLANLPMSTILDRRFRIYSGYAGWGPGQLQAEIIRGDWRIVRTGTDVIFEGDNDIIWEEMLKRSRKRSVQRDSPYFRGEAT